MPAAAVGGRGLYPIRHIEPEIARRYGVTVANGPSDRVFDPGTRRILEELRDLRVEMREDRRRSDEDRKHSDEDRKRSDEDRKRSDERFEQMRRESEERFEQGRRESQERFERMMRDFREDSIRRDVAMQKAWKELRTEVRTVGLSIVKTLNRHTRLLEHISTHHGRLLERIDRKLGARDNGRPGQGNGRRHSG